MNFHQPWSVEEIEIGEGVEDRRRPATLTPTAEISLHEQTQKCPSSHVLGYFCVCSRS
jgi:hypothetical protein